MCALPDPKSTPSGTMTAARPPVWSRRRKEREEQQLGLLCLDDLLQILGGGLIVEASRKRRIGKDQGVLLNIILVGLGQRVLVADVWVLHAVQQHVHAADAQHGVVEVVAVERVLVEVAARRSVLVDGVAVVLHQVLRRGNEEARRAAGRIADHVLGRRGGHVHHQTDDVTRRAELTVLSGGGNLSEHVLVEVALGVAVGHVDAVELVDDVGQHTGRGHHEEGIPHMVAVCRAPIAVSLPLLPERLDKGEHPVSHRLEQLLGGGVLETRPAELVLLGGEDRILDGLAGAGSLGFFERVQLVESLDEEQVGELLDDRERIRDAARPHRVPDAVDLGFECACYHANPLTVSVWPSVEYHRTLRYIVEQLPLSGQLLLALGLLAGSKRRAIASRPASAPYAPACGRRGGTTDKRTAHSEPAPAHHKATRHPRRATDRGPARGIKCEDGYDYLRQIRAELKSRIRGRHRDAIRAAGTEPAQQRRIPPPGTPRRWPRLMRGCPRRWIDRHLTTHDRKEGVGLMRKRIVFSVASLIAVLATPGCQESTTTPSTTTPSTTTPST